MPISTNEPERRLFPVFFLADASGSMAENGKWKIIQEVLSQCLQQLKDSPDPDFEVVITLLLLQNDGVAVEHHSEPVEQVAIQNYSTSGQSNYSAGIEKLLDLLKENKLPKNAHVPCLVLMGDGHVDSGFMDTLDKCLKDAFFKKSTRIVVEIGNDFEPNALRNFVSSPNNFFTVMDMSTMPYFYMRLASSINSQAIQSQSRRILQD
jgi:uncharacterized protein YegL